MSYPRLVVCAAIRSKDDPDLIVCGARHGDCLNFANYRLKLKTYADDGSHRFECGFVDQNRDFMTRDEAWVVADAAGQIRRPKGYERNYDSQRPPGIGDTGKLFSENLY